MAKLVYVTKYSIALTIVFSTILNAQSFDWAKDFNSQGVTIGISVALDQYGNVYSAGTFTGTSDFDPGSGTYTIASGGPAQAFRNVYISKLDSNGNFVWAKSFTGSWVVVYKIVCDSLGNLFVSGQHNSVTDFNPGIPGFTLAATGTSDNYVCKLDQAGNVLWVKNFKNDSWLELMTICEDGIGGVYAAAAYTLQVDVDPGPGVNLLTTSSNADVDSYIVHLNSNGGLLWAKKIGSSTSNYDKIYALDVDQYGSLFAGGRFSQTVDFDPGPGFGILTSATTDGFILKLNSQGNFVKVLQIGGLGTNGGVEIIQNLDVNSLGIFYSGLHYGGVGDFNPGVGTYTMVSSNFNSYFVSRLDTAGNFIYAGNYQSNSIYILSIAADLAGSAYITGYLSGTGDFDPASGNYPLSSNGGTDVFVSKLDYLGELAWATSTGGNNNDYGNTVKASPSGAVHITGHYNSSLVDFDPSSSTYNLSNPNCEGYVWKVKPCSSSNGSIVTTSPGTVCAGQLTLLTASAPNANIRWYTSVNSLVSISMGPFFVTPAFTTPGLYTYYAESSGCAFANQRVPVSCTVIPQPTIIVSSLSNTVCPGTSITLTATGASNYLWSTSATTSVTTVTPTTNTIYMVSDTVGLCGSSSTVAAIMKPTPNISISSSNLLCAGNITTLTANGAVSYTWNGVPNMATLVVTLTPSTIYSVQGLGSNGCISSKSVNIIPLPIISVVNNNATICERNSVKLIASGANTYTWSTGQLGASVAVNPSTSAQYTIWGTSTLTGCTGITNVLVNVAPCVGVLEEGSEESFHIYPNPNTGVFTIETAFPIELDITDIMSRVVYKEMIEERKTKIGLPDLPAGVYFVSLRKEGFYKRFRMVREE